MSWRRLEDVLKTYDQDEYVDLDEDVLKTSSEDEDQRRLQDVFIKRMFAGIYMNKMENGIVVQAKPVFYRRFVDDIYNRRRKKTEDKFITRRLN